MSCIVGIDPGAYGAIAVVNQQLDCLFLGDIPHAIRKVGKTRRRIPDLVPCFDVLETICRLHNPEVMCIEQPFVMPGRGANGALTSGYNWGIWEGMAAGFSLRVRRVAPRDWKRKAGIPVKADKRSSILEASRRFPEAEIGKKDGRAEALLIAASGWQ